MPLLFREIYMSNDCYSKKKKKIQKQIKKTYAENIFISCRDSLSSCYKTR